MKLKILKENNNDNESESTLKNNNTSIVSLAQQLTFTTNRKIMKLKFLKVLKENNNTLTMCTV